MDDDDDTGMSAAKEAAYAKQMLQRADLMLAEADSAYIISERGHKVRRLPTFRAEEITLGKMLGTGGFGIVHEIKKFTLDPEQTTASDKKILSLIADDVGEDEDDDAKIRINTVEIVDQPEEVSQNDHIHYDARKARHMMEKRCIRRDVCRYAIKRLHRHLTELERARGMIDLALEAKFLSIVWHPNIVKLRGMATGNMVDPGFFIIMDRLHETLDKKMNTWHVLDKDARRWRLCGKEKQKEEIKELLLERLTVAYDLAAAFFYLHENRLVYRDIKPENVGFDLRGDVKVFDFGLCKSLSPKLKARGDDAYGYRLTGRAGSLPYMAPEVVRMETYDTKCDVFSFAILLWEMLSLQKAYDGFTASDFVERVVMQNERLPIRKAWPPLTRLVLPEAWDRDPRLRPDMKRVAILIRGDLNDMTTDARVLHRTNHMDDRSHHSIEMEAEVRASGPPDLLDSSHDGKEHHD